MDNSNIKKKLDSINWDFDFTIDYRNGSVRPFNCRKYYSYPATFIPEIPYALIEILSKKGDIILDPFGGIGTTFMQALISERIPYSFDINPVSSMVCKTLFELFDPSIDREAIKKELHSVCNDYIAENDYTLNLSNNRKDLAAWFENETFNELAFLFECFDSMKNVHSKNAMELVISSILVTSSSQNKGWAYIADNVKPKEDELRQKSVFEYYKSAVRILLDDITEYANHLPESYNDFYRDLSKTQHVFNDSVTNIDISPESVDLIITSPPYPKMIDYVKSQRLSLGFLDKDFSHFVDKEIGARCRRCRRDFLLEYIKSISEVNEKIISVLKPGGYLCVVLPDYDLSDARKETIDTLVESYLKANLTKVFEVSRYIPSNKRTLSIQWATLVNERVYIFQKG